MKENPTPALKKSTKLFISYRREDSAGHTGRLFDSISNHFGHRVLIFRDIESIKPGVDWVGAIESAVASCEVLVAVIGSRWLSSKNKHGQRRLDDPNDPVRIEIEAALTRNITVIPVLVQGAAIPDQEELPESMAKLTRRNAIEVTDSRWSYDVGRLLSTLDEELAPKIPAGRRFANLVGIAITLFIVTLLSIVLWQWVNTSQKQVTLQGQWKQFQLKRNEPPQYLATINVSEGAEGLRMNVVRAPSGEDPTAISLYDVSFDGDNWVFKAQWPGGDTGEFNLKRGHDNSFEGDLRVKGKIDSRHQFIKE